MQNIKTIAGTFTIGTYEIPKQYVCAKTPTITQKNDNIKPGVLNKKFGILFPLLRKFIVLHLRVRTLKI